MTNSCLPPVEPLTAQPPYHVWVLAPTVDNPDPNIAYYYDFTQSIAEYTRLFAQLQIQWKWQPVTLQNYATIIGNIVAEQQSGRVTPIVLNLCDGDEVNGTPGLGVVQLLEQSRLIYTGADAFFYQVTTSKIPMKLAFDAMGVATAPWEAIYQPDQPMQHLFDQLGKPIIIKPAVSGGSMGVGIKNVVQDAAALHTLVQQLFSGYRGWNLSADGLIAETFITGPEYTVMIVGAYQHPEACTVYDAVERVFHASLPEQEKFLSFDRLWEIYEEESPMPDQANFYEYRLAPAAEQEALKALSLQAYLAVKGTGYTRVDLRRDQQSGQLYVLEVNAQCGLSEDEDFTSIGAILRVNQVTFTELIQQILTEAIHRYAAKKTAKAIPQVQEC